MRRLLPLLLVLATFACGSSKPPSPPPPPPLAHVDLTAAARQLLASGAAHATYSLALQPPRQTPLPFVTHTVGEFDFATGDSAYVAGTQLAEASSTVVVGGKQYVRSLGGGVAGAGNAPTPWHRVAGRDASPAGLTPLVPRAADGARDVRRIGPRAYEATVVVGRTPPALRSFLRGTFGAPRGLAQFVLDARGRLVVVRLLNPNVVQGRTLVYTYTYSRLGERVRVRAPRVG